MSRISRNRTAFDPYFVIILTAVFIILGLTSFYLVDPFAATQSGTGRDLFTVPEDYGNKVIATRLKKQGIIKSKWAFLIALDQPVMPGGYYLTGKMDAWEVAEKLEDEPDLVRVTIPEGWRKEQTAELLAGRLNWNAEEKKNWLTEYTATSPEIAEGLYFPDTYLIPRGESPRETGRRLRHRFHEILRDYNREALRKDIPWTTLVTLASIIEREASGNGDRSLISGIFWNRLRRNMKLDTDSTVQYIRDTRDDNGQWWEPLEPGDIEINSPYNTYRHRGLPPAPINSPGRAALKAALHPEPTDYLYYLHDNSGSIHCARTYDDHLENIAKYLKHGSS